MAILVLNKITFVGAVGVYLVESSKHIFCDFVKRLIILFCSCVVVCVIAFEETQGDDTGHIAIYCCFDKQIDSSRRKKINKERMHPNAINSKDI